MPRIGWPGFALALALYSVGTHVAMRGLFGLTVAMGLFAVTAFVVNRSTEVVDVLGSAFFIAFPAFIGRIALRTRPVWLDGDYPEVAGRSAAGALDVIDAEYPLRARSDDKAMLPLKVTLRGQPPVFFFPAHGAQDLIFGARRHARDLAEAQGSP